MMIETDTKLRVVGEASSFELADEIMSEEAPDLVVVDLPDFADQKKWPTFQSPHVPILLLVGKHNEDIHQMCLRTGISGLILKEEDSATLFKSIKKIHDGEIWYDRVTIGQTIRQLLNERKLIFDHRVTKLSEHLTTRELEIVDLVCIGLKNKTISEHLALTETAVRLQLRTIFNKLGIKNRLELVLRAFSTSSNGSHATGEVSHYKNGSPARNGD